LAAGGWPRLLLSGEKAVLPQVPLAEPDRAELLKAETELLGFAVSGHRSICIRV
jgi:hypothetical protein